MEGEAMKTLHVKVTLTEELLGMSASSPDIHDEFIASKAPDALSREEEVAALGVDEVIAKGKTIFPKLEDGTPFLWDYQIKGSYKDVCGGLRRVDGTKSAKLKAYKKVIGQTIFVEPRKIPINVVGDIGSCQRPLRAETAQGSRVAIADSETIPAGSWFEYDVILFNDSDEAIVTEWLNHGKYFGLGQWRSSGKGRFLYEIS
jgi:hypothetical protein